MSSNDFQAVTTVAQGHRQHFRGAIVQDPKEPKVADAEQQHGMVAAPGEPHPVTSKSRALTSGVPDERDNKSARTPEANKDADTQEQYKAAQNTYTHANRPGAAKTFNPSPAPGK